MKRQTQFETIRSEGGLLPTELLQRVREADKDLGGLRGEDYGLPPNEPLNEAIVRSWNRLVGAWGSFQEARAKLVDDDPGTTVTRERWLLVLLHELGYGRVQTANAVVIDGKSYAVSHSWAPSPVPIHLVGCEVKLDTRSRGVAGAATQSPHGTLQELLNRSDERLWGIVSNGLQLRLLRDNSSLTRQAYVEFDLEAMLDSEAYADFALLWLVCHASRVEGERTHECWLEKWSQEATRHGTRALDGLRNGVEAAIKELGSGFLHPGTNANLKEALRSGDLTTQDYYRQLLRLVYRLMFLFVAEDRQLLHDPASSDEARERYAEWYSTARLRDLAGKRRGTKHTDLWQALRLLMQGLGNDDGCPALGLPSLGSYLWSEMAIEHLNSSALSNRSLLEAVRALATVSDGKVLRTVDYKNLGAEELGSVYESLLELHPQLDADAGTFDLSSAAGNERRTTGSYYTPTSLISCLLDSALDSVLDEAATEGEDAILDLKVCDPACGSGHFLVAAGHRIAKRLAAIRTGDEEPSPEATRHALRDVVSRCLYGVDINPMAVELCKVSLWMEALDPGRPLSFLDAHIKCGNSLVGTTAAHMSAGVPDEAFKALDGDDGEIAKSLRQQNKIEREGQLSLEDAGVDPIGVLEAKAAEVDAAGDSTVADLHAKEQLLRDLVASADYERARISADAWCAAFVQHKGPSTPRITTAVVRRLASDSGVPTPVLDEVRRVASDYGFFHWEVEFPHVFRRARRGFDVVVGNPPWEQIQFDPKEFAYLVPELAAAKNLKARKKIISRIAEESPDTHAVLARSERAIGAIQHFIHVSSRFPLTSKGRLNTAPLFAELARALLSTEGRIGVIVPTGIATDSFNQWYFRDLVESRTLVSLLDFENKLSIFPGVAPPQKFCILTISGKAIDDDPLLLFFAHRVEDLHDRDRYFRLASSDFSLLNPETSTCPIFRSRHDAEITLRIYRTMPTIREGWDLDGLLIFMMDAVSEIGETLDDLSNEGWHLEGNVFFHDNKRALPVYEAKMVHQFDCHFNTFLGVPRESRFGVKPMALPVADAREDPTTVSLPRYWVPESSVEERLRERLDRRWMIAWRDTTNVTTNRRTLVACALPRVACGDTLPVLLPADWSAQELLGLLACLNSYPCDYVARQKVGGSHLRFHVFQQLAVPPPAAFHLTAPWDDTTTVGAWVGDRSFELSYTSIDMQALAQDMGNSTPPFRWNPQRRSLIRAELDAAFFHVYGLDETEVDYVMETFPIVKRRDEERFGEYRTKALILDVYRRMRDAIETGFPYETILDPPPADPRVAHQDQLIRATTELGQ